MLYYIKCEERHLLFIEFKLNVKGVIFKIFIVNPTHTTPRTISKVMIKKMICVIRVNELKKSF